MYNIMEKPAPLPLFDITANRHQGNAESREAFKKIGRLAFNDRQLVYQRIHQAGAAGVTVKEVAQGMGVQINQISGRFTELKAAGLIRKVAVRDGCGAYADAEVADA